MDQSEDEFGAFDQFDPSEGHSGDLGNPSLIEADLQGTSSQADMGFKRKPSASLHELLEGQPRKDVPAKSQPKLPFPPSKPQPPPDQVIVYLTGNQPNSPPLFNPLTLKGKGLPKGKILWTGGDPALLKRRTRAGGLRNN